MNGATQNIFINKVMEMKEMDLKWSSDHNDIITTVKQIELTKFKIHPAHTSVICL